MEAELFPELSRILDKVMPLLYIFIAYVFINNNLKDVVIEWGLSLRLRWSKLINESDTFIIEDKKCVLIKIGSWWMVFLVLDENGKPKENEEILISIKKFVYMTIRKTGRL